MSKIAFGIRIFSFFFVLLVLQAKLWAQADNPCVGPCVLTRHYDLARNGVQRNETILTPAKIKPAGAFGKVATITGLQGQIYAQPLYISGLTSIASKGNVVFVATEHDYVYAFDADTYTMLWGNLYLPAGETPLSTGAGGDVSCTDVSPNIGITSTPVIDPSTKFNSNPTIYFVTASVDSSKRYHQRLHAVDVTTGAEVLGGPVEIATPPGSSVPFSPLLQLQRTSLTLTYDSNNNPQIYIGWGSNCDHGAYHGWVMKFSVTLGLMNSAPTAYMVTTAAGVGGGIWGSGAALAADNPVNGNLFLGTGNGGYNGTSNFGETILKLSSNLNLVDWYTPNNWKCLNGITGNPNCGGNQDFGSGGVVLFNPPGGVPELVTAGKQGEIYVLYQSNLGHLDPAPTSPNYALPITCTTGPPPPTGGPNNIAQCFAGIVNSVGSGGAGAYGTFAFWNNSLYTAGSLDTLRAYPLGTTNIGSFSTPGAAATNPQHLPWPGASPVISWNGSNPSTAIVWTLQTSGYQLGSPAVLQAYSAVPNGSSVLAYLYGTGSTGPAAVKFVEPTVANGKVFIAGQGFDGTGTKGRLYVYGLCPCIGPNLTSVSPKSGATTGGTPVTITGTRFLPGATVNFAGTPATDVTVVSNTQITATAPRHAAGAVNLTVTNPDGQSATSPRAYTYASMIKFVQVRASTPSSATVVSVAYPMTQSAGNLNIVVIGWNDASSSILSVHDSAGNVYNVAAPTIAIGSGTGAVSQAIYYAPKIVSGTNTVTITFNQATTSPDVRILEYGGVDTLDVTAGASGTGSTSSSRPANITFPNELLFAGNTVSTVTTGPGPGFTSRIITASDGNIAEDEIVNAVGTYSATAPLSSSGNWIMQLATFK